MEAKEGKSRFVYPDKLYARANNNITLDISYAPQTLESVEYVLTDAFIYKACEWLKTRCSDAMTDRYFIEDFKSAMKT